MRVIANRAYDSDKVSERSASPSAFERELPVTSAASCPFPVRQDRMRSSFLVGKAYHSFKSPDLQLPAIISSSWRLLLWPR